MNHDEATRYFDELGATAESRAPVAELLTAGRDAERRKRRRTIVGSVVAVALILGGGAAVQQATAGGDDAPVPNPLAEAPVAPDGMRLVGKGRVVVAVPESWSTGVTRCGEPTEATVWFPQEIDYDCPNPPDGWVPQLKIGDLSSPLGSRLFESATPTTSTLTDGTEVIEAPILCMDSFPEACSIQMAVPSEDTYFILIVYDMDEREFVQSFRDSLQVLPEGFTTVPWVEPGTPRTAAQDLVANAGLVLEAGESDSIAPVPGTDPAGGTVVRVGSTLTLSLEQRRDRLTDEQAAAAGRIVQTYLDDNPTWDVDSAWARWEEGTVDQPNVGECRSGELLQISLFGSFDIAVSGYAPVPGSTPSADPDPLAGVPTEVLLTADAETEEVCLLGVGTGTRQPDPEATVVYAVEDESDPVPPQSGPTLDGTWNVVLSNITGAGMHRDVTFTLHLGGGLMRGDDECNTFGSYYATSGRDLRFGPIESTLIGCDSTADFLHAMNQVRHVTSNGDELHLHADSWGILMTLRRVDDVTSPQVPENSVVDLPTSEWTPGNGGDGAEIHGVLSLDEDDCVYLDADGTQVWPVWPRGYSAVIVRGTVHLLDSEVNEVAEQGDALVLGGSYTSGYTPLTGEGCLPDEGEMALVQSSVDGSGP